MRNFLRTHTLDIAAILLLAAVSVWFGYTRGSIDTAEAWSEVTTKSADLADRCIAKLESFSVLAKGVR